MSLLELLYSNILKPGGLLILNQKYMPDKQKVLVASSLHPWDDPRIFYKECHSLKKHYDITLVAVGEQKSFYKDNIQIIGLSKSESIFGRLANAVKIIRELLIGKYAIFHFHDPELLWVGLIAKLFAKKVIYDIHENILGVVQMRNWIPKIIKKPLGIFILLLEKITPIIFDGVLLSEKSYLKHFRKNNNIIIVQNFVEVDSYRIVQSKPKDHTIIYVGAVTYSRGILDLVKAVVELQKNNPTIKLIIIGRLPNQKFKRKLHDVINSAPSPENIQILGHINFLQLNKYVSTATIGVIPLHSNDNYLFSYPTKIFDYMNWGLPFVYTDIPYWKETFGEKCGGVSFKACDKIDLIKKIEKILYDEYLWSQLSKNCRKNIQKFNWNTEEIKLLQLYNDINGTNR